MAQEIEIERKNQLTQAEFVLLADVFKLNGSDFFLQINHYFETNDFSLKQQKAALRIREKSGSYTLTLKQPHNDGLLETHQVISESIAKSMLATGALPDGDVKKQLKSLDIEFTTLSYLGALSTSRAERQYHEATVVLDKSFYLGTTDYELELEAQTTEKADALFSSILNTYAIQERPTKNKIARFFERKIALESSKDS